VGSSASESGVAGVGSVTPSPVVQMLTIEPRAAGLLAELIP
jgi:hypothetical protein